MRRRLFAGALLLLALGFIGLGVWQVERRAWKLRLIQQVNARVHAAPTALGALDRTGLDGAYRHVSVHGVFLDDRQTFVQAVTERGPGWWVMTPLRTPAGIVLINRGFVPPDRRALADGRDRAPSGAVDVTGLIRLSEPHGGFLRANDPGADRWYSRDVAAIGAARGLAPLAPFFIDADASPDPGAYPVGGLTVVSFRNAHLAYALTWFALSAMSLYGFALVLKRREA